MAFLKELASRNRTTKSSQHGKTAKQIDDEEKSFYERTKNLPKHIQALAKADIDRANANITAQKEATVGAMVGAFAVAKAAQAASGNSDADRVSGGTRDVRAGAHAASSNSHADTASGGNSIIAAAVTAGAVAGVIAAQNSSAGSIISSPPMADPAVQSITFGEGIDNVMVGEQEASNSHADRAGGGIRDLLVGAKVPDRTLGFEGRASGAGERVSNELGVRLSLQGELGAHQGLQTTAERDDEERLHYGLGRLSPESRDLILGSKAAGIEEKISIGVGVEPDPFNELFPPMGNAAARLDAQGMTDEVFPTSVKDFLLFAINEGIESGKEYAENKNGYDYPSRVEKMVSEDEGDNKTMYQKESQYGQPWCGDFVGYCVDESEYETQFDTQRSAWKYSDRTDPELINSAADGYRPYSGDIFYYYINENQELGIDEFKHVGVVIASDDEYYYTVEGNNNDMVRFVRRPYDNVEGLYFVTNNVSDSNLVDYNDIDFVDPDGESVT